MTDPVILAFDTSGAYCAAALMWGDGQIAIRHEDMARGQGERLMVLLEELLAQDGFEWSDLDALAVGVGPGNFTGIRIGVSAARGLALGLGIPVIAVSNFEIMRGPNCVTDTDPQLVSLPAPRGTVYTQIFEGGAASQAPSHITVSPDMPDLGLPVGASVLGENALDLMNLHLYRTGADQTGLDRAFDRTIVNVADTMIRIAAAKWHAGKVDDTRPAPLYVRPADAAPPRDTPPVILP